jgi:thymidylate kinase
MPLTDSILTPELTQPQHILAEGFDPSRDVFFSVFLLAMERNSIRYRALRFSGGLLYGTEFAVDPSDERKLATVFSDVKDAGFLPVQSLELKSGGHRIIFARIASGQSETNVIDLVFEKASESQDASRPDAAKRAALRQRLSPGGASLVFLGPDGVGKTTLLRAVSESLKSVFPEQNIYRWRPAVFARAPRLARMPHSKPARSWWGSISYLFFTWLDFTSGYALAIRSALSRNALVIFDRFYHDLLIDPKRYRFGGPLWLVRAVSRIVPPRDLFFVVLDADEETILSRKQQLPPEEIRRQRRAYRDFAAQAPASVVVSTQNAIEQCRAEALERIFQYLAARLAERNPAWFGTARAGSQRTSSAALLQAETLDCKPTLNSAPPQS